jgi:hypothetical protein
MKFMPLESYHLTQAALVSLAPTGGFFVYGET